MCISTGQVSREKKEHIEEIIFEEEKREESSNLDDEEEEGNNEDDDEEEGNNEQSESEEEESEESSDLEDNEQGGDEDDQVKKSGKEDVYEPAEVIEETDEDDEELFLGWKLHKKFGSLSVEDQKKLFVTFALKHLDHPSLAVILQTACHQFEGVANTAELLCHDRTRNLTEAEVNTLCLECKQKPTTDFTVFSKVVKYYALGRFDSTANKRQQKFSEFVDKYECLRFVLLLRLPPSNILNMLSFFSNLFDHYAVFPKHDQILKESVVFLLGDEKTKLNEEETESFRVSARAYTKKISEYNLFFKAQAGAADLQDMEFAEKSQRIAAKWEQEKKERGKGKGNARKGKGKGKGEGVEQGAEQGGGQPLKKTKHVQGGVDQVSDLDVDEAEGVMEGPSPILRKNHQIHFFCDVLASRPEINFSEFVHAPDARVFLQDAYGFSANNLEQKENCISHVCDWLTRVRNPDTMTSFLRARQVREPAAASTVRGLFRQLTSTPTPILKCESHHMMQKLVAVLQKTISGAQPFSGADGCMYSQHDMKTFSECFTQADLAWFLQTEPTSVASLSEDHVLSLLRGEDKNRLVFCAEGIESRKILGFLLAKKCPDTSYRLEVVCVCPLFRCQKIGFELVKCFLEMCQNDDGDDISVECTALNTYMGSILQACGFEAVSVGGAQDKKEYIWRKRKRRVLTQKRKTISSSSSPQKKRQKKQSTKTPKHQKTQKNKKQKKA